MKFSNFNLIETRGDSPINYWFFATVNVKAGFWRKKIISRKIARQFSGFWHFVDTGEFCPGNQVDALARAWTAQTGEKT